MRRKLYLLMALLFIGVSTISLPGKVAFATSVYDTAFTMTDDLNLYNQSCGSGGLNDYPMTRQDVIDAVKNDATYGSAFDSAMTSGRYGISNFTRWNVNGSIVRNAIEVFWTPDTSLYLDWRNDYWGAPYRAVYAHGSSGNLTSVLVDAHDVYGDCQLQVQSTGFWNLGVVSEALTDGGVRSNFLQTDYPSYPSGYEGMLVNAAADVDQDGLTGAQESDQSTSDGAIDTDGDGLRDFVESQWNPDYHAIFCDTSTPRNCADPHPNARDVYVEMDWMNNSSPSESYEPNATQIGLVTDAFAAKGIYFHADTGEFGGGNQLSSYTAPLKIAKDLFAQDFFDYKSSNFNSVRQGVWRYMISGYNYSEAPTSSGGSYAGSDNIFVSYGYIKNHQSGFYWTDIDTAIGGTMLHEIGHSLCLSSGGSYSFQMPDCQYEGVDSGLPNQDDYPYYDSVMNYANQMGMTFIDYSTGANSYYGDHDDWSAIEDYMDDFTQWDYDSEFSSPGVSANHSKNPKLSIAITTKKAKELKQKGLLKTGKATWRHLKVDSSVKDRAPKTSSGFQLSIQKKFN